MQNLFDAFELVQANQTKASFAGARPESLVRAAEQRLGVNFPPTYRHFLLRFGAGNFGSAEFYGVIDENFDASEVPNGIWFTLSERSEASLPDNLVVVGSTGDGDLYCLETAKGREAPVIVFQPGTALDEQRHEIVAEDFGTFMLDQVNAQLVE